MTHTQYVLSFGRHLKVGKSASICGKHTLTEAREVKLASGKNFLVDPVTNHNITITRTDNGPVIERASPKPGLLKRFMKFISSI